MKQLFIIIVLFFTYSFSKAQEVEVLPVMPNEASGSVFFLRDSIVNYGKHFLSIPYRYAGRTVKGFDCSGFTCFVYQNFGYTLPPSSATQAAKYNRIEQSELLPGDLVFFSGRRLGSTVGHVGIVTEQKVDGSFDFIHAAVTSGITISNSHETYYARRYIKGGRVLEDENLNFYTENSLPQNAEEKIKSIENQIIKNENEIKIIQPIVHIVKQQETLYSIAKKYGCTVEDLKNWNEKRGNALRIGEELNIYTSLIHRVEKGETIYSISKKYACTVDDLKKWNAKTDDNLYIGEELHIYTQNQ